MMMLILVHFGLFFSHLLESSFKQFYRPTPRQANFTELKAFV